MYRSNLPKHTICVIWNTNTSYVNQVIDYNECVHLVFSQIQICILEYKFVFFRKNLYFEIQICILSYEVQIQICISKYKFVFCLKTRWTHSISISLVCWICWWKICCTTLFESTSDSTVHLSTTHWRVKLTMNISLMTSSPKLTDL